MIIFMVWWLMGILGSIMIALGTGTDNEGFDSWDVFFLSALSLAGLGTFLIGIPFASIYIRSKMQ